MWCLFGGNSEPNEQPAECLLRELHEELGIQLSPADLVPLREVLNPRTGRMRHVFLIPKYVPSSQIMLGEGAGFGWFEVESAFRLPLTQGTREELDYLVGLKDDEHMNVSLGNAG